MSAKLKHALFIAAGLVAAFAAKAQVDPDAFEDCNCPEGTVGQRCRFEQYLDSIHSLEAAILTYDEGFTTKNYAEVATVGTKVLEQYDCEALRDSIISLNVQLTNAMGCSDSESCNYNPASTSTLNCEYPATWYFDGDGDGLGRDSSEVACTASLNFVDNNSDLCDDTLAYNYDAPENLACIYPPNPEALNASGLAGETATLNGEVANPSGLNILEVGFYFNTDTLMPAGTNQTLPATLVDGALQFDLSSLVIGTKYYYQVYAVTSYGTVVSETHVFTAATGPCEGLTQITDYNGNTYNLVEINGQCWSAENLKATHYMDGTSIAQLYLPSPTDYNTPNRVVYNDDPGTYLDILGYGYNYWVIYATVTEGKSLCPSGFNIPTRAAWDAVIDYAGSLSESTAPSQELMSPTYWNGESPGTGLNLTGIGVRQDNGTGGFGIGAFDWGTITPSTNNIYSKYATITTSPSGTYYLNDGVPGTTPNLYMAYMQTNIPSSMYYMSTSSHQAGHVAVRCIKTSTDVGIE